MRKLLMWLIYSVSARLSDFAFYVVGKEEEDIGMEVETRWSNQLPRCKHSSTVSGSYVASHST